MNNQAHRPIATLAVWALVAATLAVCLPSGGIVAYRLWQVPAETMQYVIFLALGGVGVGALVCVLFAIFAGIMKVQSSAQLTRDNMDLLRDMALIQKRASASTPSGFNVLAANPQYGIYDAGAVDTNALDGLLLTDGSGQQAMEYPARTTEDSLATPPNWR